MNVRKHRSQHEVAEDLPMITESATVMSVDALDRNRTDEVVDALLATLDEYGSDDWAADRPPDDERADDWVRDRLDAADHLDGETPLNGYLTGDARRGPVGEKLATLQARYLRPYPSLLRITVETDDPVEFVAGQYLGVRFDGTTRVYSVASSPTREDVEFCVRRVPGGRLTSDLAVDLDPGDSVTLRGPYGDMVLCDPSERDLVFLATGTGVAPFKSMIDYVFETGRDVYEGVERDVWCFLGAGWADDLAYREAFRELDRERGNFHFVPTCSRERYLTDWRGETAYVQYALAKHLNDESVADRNLGEPFDRYVAEPPASGVDARLDPGAMDVYACGLTAMVESLVEAVEALGVPEDRTQFEGFG